MNLDDIRHLAPADRDVDMRSPELVYAYKNKTVQKLLFPLAGFSVLAAVAFFVRTKSVGGSIALFALSLLGAYGVSFTIAFRFAPTNRGVFLRDSEPIRYWLSVGIPFIALVVPLVFYFAFKK